MFLKKPIHKSFLVSSLVLTVCSAIFMVGCAKEENKITIPVQQNIDKARLNDLQGLWEFSTFEVEDIHGHLAPNELHQIEFVLTSVGKLLKHGDFAFIQENKDKDAVSKRLKVIENILKSDKYPGERIEAPTNEKHWFKVAENASLSYGEGSFMHEKSMVKDKKPIKIVSVKPNSNFFRYKSFKMDKLDKKNLIMHHEVDESEKLEFTHAELKTDLINNQQEFSFQITQWGDKKSQLYEAIEKANAYIKAKPELKDKNISLRVKFIKQEDADYIFQGVDEASLQKLKGRWGFKELKRLPGEGRDVDQTSIEANKVLKDIKIYMEIIERAAHEKAPELIYEEKMIQSNNEERQRIEPTSFDINVINDEKVLASRNYISRNSKAHPSVFEFKYVFEGEQLVVQLLTHKYTQGQMDDPLFSLYKAMKAEKEEGSDISNLRFIFEKIADKEPEQ